MKKEKRDETAGEREAAVTHKTAETAEEKKHAALINTVCMLGIFLTYTGAVVGGCLYLRLNLYYMVRDIIFCMTAALITIFSYQAGRISGSFSYDDAEHPGRFLAIYVIGVLCALVFVNLPVTGWMFLFFYIALSRVSDSTTGMCAGTGLLMLTSVLCGQVSLTTFLVYLFSGMVGIALFAHQKKEFHIAVPLGLSLGIQLLLIFSGELLIQNKKFVWEVALIPLANIVMNGILLCIFLQYYIGKADKAVAKASASRTGTGGKSGAKRRKP